MTRHSPTCIYHTPREYVRGGEPISHGICTRHLYRDLARITIRDAYRFGVGSAVRLLTGAGWFALASVGVAIGILLGIALQGWTL
jgi:hypothetical protein